MIDMQFLSHHKLVIILGVVVVAAVAWWAISGGSAPSSSLVTNESAAGVGGNVADQNLITTLLALRTVKLDGAIFSEQTFKALKDFSTQIVPEPVGRANPFAPLSSGVTSTSTPSDSIFRPR